MKFHNKDGSLTAYSFACGYIECKEKDTLHLDLWHEGACYHVKASTDKARLFWHSFEKLGEARRYFKQQTKTLF